MTFEDYKKQELVSRILTLAMKISNSQARDVFMYYSPHINSLQVDIYNNGWDIETVEERDTYEVCLDEGKCIDKLKSIIEILCDYVEERYTEGII